MNALDAKRIKRLKLSRYAIVTNGKDDWLVDRQSGKIMVAAWGQSFRQIDATIPTLRIKRETDKTTLKAVIKAIKRVTAALQVPALKGRIGLPRALRVVGPKGQSDQRPEPSVAFSGGRAMKN